MSSATTKPEGDRSPLTRLRTRTTSLPIVLSVLLILLGTLAILLPLETTLGVIIVACWLLMISGLVQVIDAFKGTGFWDTVWKITLAVAYFLTGLFLRFHLGIGLVALTIAVMSFFFVQGIVDIIVYIQTRKSGASGWMLAHGILTFLLGMMIALHWPSSALWVTGMLIGFNLIFTGITRLMLTLAIRQILPEDPQVSS